MDTEQLESFANSLNEALKPYRSAWRRRERLSKTLERCIRAARKGDFFTLDEVLTERFLESLKGEPGLGDSAEVLAEVRWMATEGIRRYQLDFKEDILAMAEEAGVTLEVDFPRLKGAKGIEGQVDFNKRQTELNGKVLKTVDPARIVSTMARLQKRLHGSPLDPQAFIDELFEVYAEMLKPLNSAVGTHVPVQQFYLSLVVARQSKRFWQDMTRATFKGYGADAFAVDLWRFFDSEVDRTTSGHKLQLRPGRGASLWLLDLDGHRRKITTLAFVEA